MKTLVVFEKETGTPHVIQRDIDKEYDLAVFDIDEDQEIMGVDIETGQPILQDKLATTEEKKQIEEKLSKTEVELKSQKNENEELVDKIIKLTAENNKNDN